MFSVAQKREIADKVQKVLRETNHPELPVGEIPFSLHVDGKQAWSWANIKNNGAVTNPGVNPWNEMQADRINQEPGTVSFKIGETEVLLLNEDGFVYNGRFIEDAGEAYRIFIDVMKDMVANKGG